MNQARKRLLISDCRTEVLMALKDSLGGSVLRVLIAKRIVQMALRGVREGVIEWFLGQSAEGVKSAVAGTAKLG